jgi:hypothetical protein
MSTKPESTETLESIADDQLESVAGGASRVSGKGGDADVTALLTQIGSSIKDLAASKSSSGGGDTMQLMLMMLMMGGGGGGGGGGVAGPTTPVINVEAIGGGRRPKGKKGW